MSKALVVKARSLILLSLLVLFFGAQSTFGAYLYLETDDDNVEASDTIELELRINTEGEKPTTTDAVIIYDENKLEYIEAKQPDEGDQFFPRFFLNPRSNKVFIGSAIQPQGTPQTGIGILSIITFKAKSAGATTITIQCEEGKTVDSNITLKKNQRVTDIIDCSKVVDAEISIGGVDGNPTPTPGEGEPTPTPDNQPTPTLADGVTPSPTTNPTNSPAPSETPTPTFEPTPTILPETGTINTAATAIGIGIGLTVLSIIIKALIQ